MLTCWYYYLFYPHHCSSIIISKVHLQQTSVKMFGFILIRFANANNVAVCCATIKKKKPGNLRTYLSLQLMKIDFELTQQP